MRIAAFHDLPSGGAKRTLYEQVRGLRALGHTVDAFVPSTAEEGFLPLADVVDEVRVFRRRDPPDRERLLEGRDHLLGLLHWAAYLARVRAHERDIADVIDARDYDVVLVHPNQVTQAPYILRWLRTPSVYYCHEPLRAAYEPRISPPVMRFAIRHTLGRVDRSNARAATAIAANSNFTAGRVKALYGRVARVVYLGVDSNRFRPLPCSREPYVLTVAALHPLKGLDFLVDAVGRVPSGQRPPFLVVSDRARQAERHRLEARASANGVDLRFAFRVDEDELVTLYNRARMVLYAPHNESFGFVPLEAMACARPVLAVPEGGVRETVVEGRTGFVADRDASRFAARMVSLLTDAEHADAVARAAAGVVRDRWRWDRSVAELAALCAEAAACGPRAREWAK